VDRSPLAELLAAIDHLDVESVVALCAPDCRLTTADGRQAEGRAETGQLLSRFLSQIRSTSHEITSHWHVDDAWIAEVLASYELRDWLKIEGLPRVFVLRSGPEGVHDIRVYGANERSLSDHGGGDDVVRIGGRLVLPL
jgi:SnoaL-like domain